jgi:hypothetical protein
MPLWAHEDLDSNAVTFLNLMALWLKPPVQRFPTSVNYHNWCTTTNFIGMLFLYENLIYVKVVTKP